MNISSIKSLHIEFSNALKNRRYIGLSQKHPERLRCSNQKNIPLTQVFQLATQYLQKNLKSPPSWKKDEISHLRELQKDGKMLYERYQQATNTWTRWMMKGVARCTPALLKRVLPSCFSNQIRQAEQQTFTEFTNYHEFIEKKIADGTKSSTPEDEDSEEVFDLELDVVPVEKKSQTLKEKSPKKSRPLQTNTKKPDSKKPDPNLLIKKKKEEARANQEKTENRRKEMLRENQREFHIQSLQKSVALFTLFAQRPLSLQKFTQLLLKMIQSVKQLDQLDDSLQNTLGILDTLGLNQTVLKVLTDSRLLSALMTQNHSDIESLLTPIPWLITAYQEAVAQKGEVLCGIRQAHGQRILTLKSEGKDFKETALQTYRGKVIVDIKDTQTLGGLQDFMEFLETHPSCSPCTLSIHIPDNQPFSPALLRSLLKLKERITEIVVEGIQEINLQNCSVTEEEESLFIQSLDSFQFPSVKHISLSEHKKIHWEVQQFSRLLALYPTLECLKECYRHCFIYQQHVVIPPQLTRIEAFDAQGLTIEEVSHLLPQLQNVTHLDLSGLPIRDSDLKTWLNQMNRDKIQSLRLDNCLKLTTDSLFLLTQLPQLTTLSLPNLTKGVKALAQLPKFDNPFKIKQFYTTSKFTQPFASNFYTGPQIWTSVFQIPLARAGVAEIFPSRQKYLDPKNVAYWLHQQDYQFLQPQKNVLRVLMDFNGEIQDDNLMEFMQKFPNTTTLSLAYCPNITEKGIIRLLKNHPKIRTLDLTGCSQIQAELFLEDGNVATLQALDRLILSGTQISKDIADLFANDFLNRENKSKITLTETTLKFTNEDLIDEHSLEKILNGKNLTLLKCIDLENCTDLNNGMLGLLLERLNADQIIQTKEGTWIDNPQRLNLALLNLKGCTAITDEAFHTPSQKVEDTNHPSPVTPQIHLKFLENLDRIVMGETKISEALKRSYSEITFQESEQPIVIQVDPDTQLQQCTAYHQKKQNAFTDEEQSELKKIAHHYMHDRITVELFCQKDLAKEILEQPIETNAQEFFDMTLSFQMNDDADPLLFPVHRDILYYQSAYFIKGLRPGGKFSKNLNLTFVNKHATPRACQEIVNLFYGKSSIENLDWETAAHVAELIGTQNFNFPATVYKKFLDRIHSQFEFSRADAMLVSANELNDEQGKKEYEATLLLYLGEGEALEIEEKDFQTITNLAKSFGLPALQKRVTEIENKRNEWLIQQALNS